MLSRVSRCSMLTVGLLAWRPFDELEEPTVRVPSRQAPT
jgi:hypothetical protein